MILLMMITCCCAFQETEMLRLTDHHSIITYHFSANRAVSSVVERLVYTERVGGSKPSPPTLHFRSSVGDLRLNSSGQHLCDGCFDMNLCCIEKWDAVVNRVAKN